MQVIYGVVGFIIGVGILVFVHELGHFVMAKLSGVRVEKFSIGFPPKIFSVRYGDTEYTLGATPIGGYVKMSGMIDENLDSEIKGEPYEFMSKNTFQKSMILLGGVLFNVLLAILIMFMMNIFLGEKKIANMPIGTLPYGHELTKYIEDENIYITKIAGEDFIYLSDLREKLLNNMDTDFEIEYETKEGRLKSAYIPSTLLMDSAFIAPLELSLLIPSKTSIASIAPNSEAERIGLSAKDTLLALGAYTIDSYNNLEHAKYLYRDKEVPLIYKRGEIVDTAMVNLTANEEGRVLLGFIPSLSAMSGTYENMIVQIDYSIDQALVLAVTKSYDNFVLFLKGLKQIITMKVSASQSIGGPIEIGKMFGQALQSGSFEVFFKFIGIISIMLALVNVLPIPGLDGGHLMIVWIEAARGKALSVETKMKIQKVGISILLFIMIFAISNDISRNL